MKQYMSLPLLFALAVVSESASSKDDSGAITRKVCAAGIATTMMKPGKIMHATQRDGVVIVAYERPSDGDIFTYKCKISGDRIIWGNVDGRWRTTPDDGVIKYMVAGDKIKVQEHYSDGSVVKKEFKINELPK